MKRLGIILLVIAVVLAAFWIGLMLNFPGETVSRYVEREVNRHQGFDLVLAPAELRWNRLYVATAELRRRDNPSARPLFVLRDFAVPITWRLIRGLPARGSIGQQGRVEAFLPWDRGGEARLDGRMELGELTLPAVLEPLRLSGPVEVHGRFLMDAEAQVGTQLPDGTLEASGEQLVVSGVQVGGTALPETRMERVDVVLETGRSVNVQRFEFRGDLQGNVDGTITPNLRDPRNSLLALQITTAFRDTWLLRLGDLRPIVESFVNRGRVRLRLSGTVGRPQLVPVRGGG